MLRWMTSNSWAMPVSSRSRASPMISPHRRAERLGGHHQPAALSPAVRGADDDEHNRDERRRGRRQHQRQVGNAAWPASLTDERCPGDGDDQRQQRDLGAEQGTVQNPAARFDRGGAERGHGIPFIRHDRAGSGLSSSIFPSITAGRTPSHRHRAIARSSCAAGHRTRSGRGQDAWTGAEPRPWAMRRSRTSGEVVFSPSRLGLPSPW